MVGSVLSRLYHAGTCILLEFNGGLMALAWRFHALHYILRVGYG